MAENEESDFVDENVLVSLLFVLIDVCFLHFI